MKYSPQITRKKINEMHPMLNVEELARLLDVSEENVRRVLRGEKMTKLT